MYITASEKTDKKAFNGFYDDDGTGPFHTICHINYPSRVILLPDNKRQQTMKLS